MDWLTISTAVLAVATISLAIFTFMLWRTTSKYATAAEKQAIAMDDQVDVMNSQKSIMVDQKEMVDRQMRHDNAVLKYHRLRDEMDKLVAPLYYAALVVKLPGDPGKFTWRNPDYDEKKRRELTLFWNEINKNIYLSQSEKLSKYLENHFHFSDLYFEELTKFPQKKAEIESKAIEFNDNVSYLIEELINHRYPDLKSEIQNVERILGIRTLKSQTTSQAP